MPRLLAALMIVSVSSAALGQQPTLRLPDESAGIDGIARTIVSAFDQFDIVALGEAHERPQDSDLRIAVVRHPDFAKKVRSIAVEFATTAEQTTPDRYIRGENVSRAQLERVRPTQPGTFAVIPLGWGAARSERTAPTLSILYRIGQQRWRIRSPGSGPP